MTGCSAACLVPFRKGKRLIRKREDATNDGQNENVAKPFLVLWKNEKRNHASSTSNSSRIVLGRRELIRTMRAACGCDPVCNDCLAVESWALLRVSRQMIQIYHEENVSGFTEKAILSVRGPNAFLVRVDHQPIVKQTKKKNGDGWRGNVELKIGSKLSLGAVQQQDVGVLEFELVLLDSETGEILPDQNVKAKTVTPTIASAEHQRTDSNAGIDKVIDLTDSPLPGVEQVNAKLDPKTSIAPTSLATSLHSAVATGDSGSARLPLESKMQPFLAQIKGKSGPRTSVKKRAQSLKKTRVSETGTRNNKTYCLYFLPLGRSMAPSRIRFLKASAKQKGALIVDSLDGPPIPTHLVLDASLPPSAVADWLGFSTPQELSRALTERNIQAVKPSWVAHAGDTLKDPAWGMFWSGIAFGGTRKRKEIKGSKSDDALKRPKHASSSYDSENIAAETDASAIVHGAAETGAPAIGADDHQLALTNDECQVPVRGRNAGLSELFTKLAKLHQDCPLQPQDEWKAYMFSMIAGRLRQLDFEIVDDDEVLARVHSIKGFGASTMNKIREYLRTGTCQRIHEFAKDPMRVAMNQFMHIWGVGKMKAKELLNMGFRNIAQVRAGVSSGVLSDLSTNQRIGLDCYEDFREKMSRKEVAIIGEIVSKACRERFPKANITIMGSYRRGKQTSGDIDILITHPDFVATTPRGALSELVERLRRRGHIAHHLTHLHGLTACEDSTDGSQDFESNEAVADGYPSSSTYMGVFCSPLVPGKRRRIDIKFYPYRERVFASLYFTGNGHFNRSMRLYSARVKGLTLNDHGLFPRNGNVYIPRPSDKMLLEPSTEKDVFDFLGLEYKDIHERDCFDAVIPKDKGVRSTLSLEEMNQSELKRDGNNHRWID